MRVLRVESISSLSIIKTQTLLRTATAQCLESNRHFLALFHLSCDSKDCSNGNNESKEITCFVSMHSF